MNQMEGYSLAIRMVVFNFGKLFQNPFLDVSVFLIIVFCLYKLMKSGGKNEQ